LRGRAGADGRSIEISPVEASHALESLTIAIGASKIPLGSDGVLGASEVEGALGKTDKDGKGTHSLRARITAQYVEAGADKSATGNYTITYKWEGGGLLGGKSLRLTGMTRG